MSRQARLVAVFGWRWEPQWLVDELLENLAPIVDDIVWLDDRDRVGPWIHEGLYRRRQRDLLRENGADWVLLTCPDERFEDAAHWKIRAAIEREPQRAHRMPIHEMWTPDAYRADKPLTTQVRLFPLKMMDRALPNRRIGSPPVNRWAARRARYLDTRVYHLKNIERVNRVRRARTMARLSWEANHKNGVVWADHLDENVQLERMGERLFSPAYARQFVWSPDEAAA